MTKLSVNINKIATIRNSRGGGLPDVTKAAQACELFGAQGITVHPRPDQRHIRYQDVRDLRPIVKTEFNIEGNPIPAFTELVLETLPDQVTLVPDSADAITSNAGWNIPANRDFLSDICKTFKSKGIRVSIFIDPDPSMAEAAAGIGADRVELYTEAYARLFPTNPQDALSPYLATAVRARECGLGLNAGHDLNLDNLSWLIRNIPWLDEVSIGHALISDALYLGLEETIGRYLAEIVKK